MSEGKRKRSDSVLWQKPLHKKQNQESTEGYSKSIVWKNTTSSEKGLASTSRTYASPKGTGPGVQRSKRPLSACHTRHKRLEHMQVPKGTGPGVWRSKRPLSACKQSNVKTQKRYKKTSITQQLRTDLRRSVWVTKTTKLVWLNWFTGSQPTN